MPTRIPYSDQQLLDYSKEHLLYEFQIFRWVGENLNQDKSLQLSALLESLAIHLRNLIDFFYTEPADARNDDVVAGHFFADPNTWMPGPMPKSLQEARERANKEVSHITYKRKAAADPTKPWPVADLFKEIHTVAQKFATEASGKKLHPKVIEWLKANAEKTAVLLVTAGASTSNTAASFVSSGAGSSAKSTTGGISGVLGGAAPSANRNTGP